MNDEQLDRYSRHILLPEIDIIGQQKILQSRVILIGLGGLGSPTALYLASSGVGQLVICDHDTVDTSNLQRQILHTTQDIGRRKVDSAHDTLKALNPDIDIQCLDTPITEAVLQTQIKETDIVIDASDNFITRFAINRSCVTTKTPLISGAAIQMSGQVAVFRNDQVNGPCYHCLYDENSLEEQQNCTAGGVLAPLTGIIGALMATEALKLLTNHPHTLNGQLLLFDASTLNSRTINISRDPHCPICSDKP